MGLAERKAVQTIKDNDFNKFTTKVTEICGYTPKINFDWSELEKNSQCVSIVEGNFHNKHMFNHVIEALKLICNNDMGKSAIKEGLKELNLVPKPGDLEYKDGTFTIHNDLTGNGVYDSVRIQEFLEKYL